MKKKEKKIIGLSRLEMAISMIAALSNKSINEVKADFKRNAEKLERAEKLKELFPDFDQ